ncbi:MAG: hypothetical protein FLDDKLPJ_01473 [Phycisphaerae bacterium]|nr:hypothetical protein [Phycisphaerae bacterium]
MNNFELRPSFFCPSVRIRSPVFQFSEPARCGGSVSAAAGACAGAQRRRENPDSGPRSHATRPADEKGPLRNDDARLRAQRHDHDRNDTTTLFAAIERATGKLIGTCMKRHRHQEWLKFLKLIDAQTPPHLDLHLIADNDSTHKHAKVRAWLTRHPRFPMPFIPTSSSWLNIIERGFREITVQRIRRAGEGHRGLHPRIQQNAQPLHLDRRPGRHPPQNRASP